MGTVITFYSYKGGTGRSMLLANIAWLLAANGERVLVIDWDLEAPGLHRYFRPFLVDPDMSETDGLIDVLWALASSALTDTPTPSPQPSKEQGLADMDLEDYISPLKWDFHSQGGIDFLGAGRQGATYSERVNTFDWKRFYQMGGGRWLDRTKASLTAQYGFVLIDSRTGVSDTSGICTIQMPDVLVACLTLNRQSIEGVASILESVRAWRTGTEPGTSPLGTRPDIVLYPVVTRIENSEQRKLDLGRARARDVLGTFLSAADKRDLRQYWDEMEVTYRPFYAYEEVLAAFGDTAGVAGSAKSLLSEMEGIGRRVTGRRDLRMSEIPELERQKVLAEYALTVVAPDQEGTKGLVDAKVPDQQDTEFLRSVYAKEVRWRRNGYQYGDLLSRREIQLLTPEDRAQFGRQMSFFHQNSELFETLREKTQNTFLLITFVFALLGVALLLPSLVDRLTTLYVPSNWFRARDMLTVASPVVFFSGIVFKAFLIHRSPVTPYGVRLGNVVKLCLLSPFVRDIRDFEEAPQRG